MIYNGENAEHIKNHNGSMRILEYLECYKDGCIFDDIFYDLSKHIPKLTIAYVLSIVEVLKEEKYITCSKREGFHYYNISDIGIEFLAVEKEKSERKKSKKNISSNSDDFQTVGKLIQTSEDFIKSLESVFEARKKDIISSNQNEIAEKKLLKENLKSEIKGLSFFDFKTRRAKKAELKSLKQTITVIKNSKHIHNLVNAEKSKLDKIKNDYIAEIDLFLDNRCRVPLKQQYDAFLHNYPDYLQKPSRTNRWYEKKTAHDYKYMGVMILKHLYVSGKKSPNELAEFFKTIVPNCTPQYIMSIIKPLHDRGYGILVKTEEKCVAYFQIKDLAFMKKNPRWYEKEIKEYEKSPFSKWYFLNDDLIFENEKIPNIPKI